ncbi:hypothetical protein BKA64DRAFT_646101 [Cadophora sp. MPI-SDFR-AT-0126]|nr:hypothetical protein BKA64DRAFT_646101 [Leotiomycetes sp. MPI-SDFR-AT-0126]
MLPQRVLAVLSLAVASVSAIDLRFFNQNNCARNYWVACNNANPGFCCFTTDDAYGVSAGLFAIPTSWNLVCQWWDQTGCSSGPLKATTLNYGRDWVCRGAPVSGQQGWVRGLSYYFNGRKREVVETRGTEGCQRANTLHLDDGSEYDLSNLSNATYSEV